MGTPWLYNELSAPGVDHGDLSVAEEYDRRHASMYDPVASAQHTIKKVGLGAEETLVDLGAGTGTLAIEAARQCRKVYAVDVSRSMLDRAANKAESAGVKNVRFIQAGFLTYEHESANVDAVVSLGALHHLPDFWKGIALQRMFEMLRPGGRLLLSDAAYSFPLCDHQEAYERNIANLATRVAADFLEQIETDLAAEFMTFTWIIEGLLERVGYEVDRASYPTEWRAEYLCHRLC